MNSSIRVIERRARISMGILSVVLVLGLIAAQAGLITRQQSYKADAWYQTSSLGSAVVLREFTEESACRKEADSPNGCRSGQALQDQARAEATSIQLR